MGPLVIDWAKEEMKIAQVVADNSIFKSIAS